ncbi:MAG: hypothetical protein RLZZ31_745 [Actinomycetota bacterium]|jgi:SDR family mycofactocin-dependent oxidoreductase
MTRRPFAVITGAARGIGACTAQRLAQRGYSVALLDLAGGNEIASIPAPYQSATMDDLESAVARCGGHGHGYSIDVRDGDAMVQLGNELAEKFGGIDVAVAAAGAVSGSQPLWETSSDVWQAMVEINLTGVFHLVRATVGSMLSSPAPRHGRFIAVASAAAHYGLPQLGAYSAAKHGVAGLISSLAAELGTSGVTANAVCPGSTRTAMLDASAAVYGLNNADEFAQQARIGRLIDPDEIAATIEWLATDAPSALTGALIDVDGGFSA